MGAAILLAWAGSLLWLTRRDPASPRSLPARPQLATVSPASAYYRLTLQDSLVGFAMYTVDTSTTAVELVELLDVRVPNGDGVMHIYQRTSSVFNRRLDFVGLDVTRRDPASRWVLAGRRVSDSAFSWRLAQDGGSSTDTVATAGTTRATGPSVGLLMQRGRRPRLGDTTSMLVADPLRRTSARVHVTVTGDSTMVVPDSAAIDSSTMQWVAARWDTVRVLRLTRRGSGPPLETWVDEDGFPVAGELIPGLRLERLPYEMATNEYRAAIGRGFPGLGARAASRIAAEAPPALAMQRVLLPGVLQDTAGWSHSGVSGGSQHLVVDTLEVQRLSVTGAPAAIGGAPASAMFSDRDTALLRAARSLGPGGTDTRRKVGQILRWVRSEVPGGADTAAVDVRQALRQRRGGPANRAALFGALGRAAGLETRMVSGLVARRGNGWARHTWAEVLLEEWVPADPTFGTFPAGGAYVRLLVDAPADPLYLVPLAAALDPEPLTRQRVR